MTDGIVIVVLLVVLLALSDAFFCLSFAHFCLSFENKFARAKKPSTGLVHNELSMSNLLTNPTKREIGWSQMVKSIKCLPAPGCATDTIPSRLKFWTTISSSRFSQSQFQFSSFDVKSKPFSHSVPIHIPFMFVISALSQHTLLVSFQHSSHSVHIKLFVGLSAPHK